MTKYIIYVIYYIYDINKVIIETEDIGKILGKQYEIQIQKQYKIQKQLPRKISIATKHW